MIQPKVLLDLGTKVCGRYLGKKLELPIEDHLCTAPPVVRLYAARPSIGGMDGKTEAVAAMCSAHADEVITAHPEWVAHVAPLNEWGESEISKEKSELLATMKAAAGKTFV